MEIHGCWQKTETPGSESATKDFVIHELPTYVGSPCSLNPIGGNVDVGPAWCCAHSESASQLISPKLRKFF